MKELSLFSGAGGGLLGTHHLLGWRTLGYVEFNTYCQRVIAARIRDGLLDEAPIYGDIRAFVSDGYAASYRGMVDVVSGGFPCQPFSCAGNQHGAEDPRNMWPATLEVIRLVRPRYAFLENVSGLLSSGYFGTILGDLAESGYDCRWRILSAAEVGANHLRKRLWLVAYTGGKREGRIPSLDEDAKERTTSRAKPCGCSSGELANAKGERSQIARRCVREGATYARFADSSWWQTEPDVGRVVDGMADRVDRLKAIGNGQVPLVAATAWRLLTEDMFATPAPAQLEMP